MYVVSNVLYALCFKFYDMLCGVCSLKNISIDDIDGYGGVETAYDEGGGGVKELAKQHEQVHFFA